MDHPSQNKRKLDNLQAATAQNGIRNESAQDMRPQVQTKVLLITATSTNNSIIGVAFRRSVLDII